MATKTSTVPGSAEPTAQPARPRGRRTAARDDGTRLVIVESPAKARTIAGYLGPGWVVESSIGHIRDLPGSAAEVPAEKKELWKTYAIDVDNGFQPVYVVSADKKGQVAKLRRLVKGASEVYLATDEDREGEAIAWHLAEVLGLSGDRPAVPVRRMVFHEITQSAIQAAVDAPRSLDMALVSAQETRRILDRLYGYEVSPVLWKKVMPKLSAGRVQSVATRMVVERERHRMRFVAAGYWGIEGRFAVRRKPSDPTDPRTLSADLVGLDGSRLATGRDFGENGQLTQAASNAGVVVLGEARARGLAQSLTGAQFAVRSVDSRPYRRSPYPPFMTSTLQQEAGRKLRMSAKRCMQTAQRLYENGYITYMRTDSITLSETAVAAAREQARLLYGADFVPERPRSYTRKVKNAQEAHEAIRPAGDRFRTAGEVSGELSGGDLGLYELIWQRTVASQMADATGTSSTIRLGARATTGEDAEFSASGKVITFPGFLRAYVEGTDDPEAELEDRERRLPVVAAGDPLDVDALEPGGHQTTPPARYTEASLVKALEELGVGRPSTYASIISTIQDRGYVWKKGSALVPSFVAFAVIALLEAHFGRLVDYAFTSSVEDDLDDIATGTLESARWLTRFYFGADADTGRGKDGGIAQAGGLKRMVTERMADIDAREINSIPIGVDEQGREVVVRVGRYGPYVQCGEDRASVPEDLAPDELDLAKAAELLATPSGDRVLGVDPASGHDVVARTGRYGPYVTTAPPEGSKDKPRTASLFASMTLDTIGLEDALQLLTLPRVLGVDPADKVKVTAQNGRYGPYVKKGSDSRSFESEERLLTITLEEALGLLAQPKQRRGGGAAAAPLRTLGGDPASGGAITVLEGRFGPYVTDGTTNASLRKGDEVDSVTVERAAELLADRRARGPAPKKRAPAGGRKKAAGAGKR